jgi:hypothetical protein
VGGHQRRRVDGRQLGGHLQWPRVHAVAGAYEVIFDRDVSKLLKRRRREEYRDRVNDLLGTSPAALSKLPDLAATYEFAPKSAPNSLAQAA